MKEITLDIQNSHLSELVREQLAHIAQAKIVETGSADHGDEKAVGLLITDRTDHDDISALILGGKTGENSLAYPLRLGQFRDRVRYLLSGRDRFSGPAELVILGGLKLDAQSQGLTDQISGASIKLTDKEKLIIFALYQAQGHKLSRKDLLQAVWGYAETAETHTLETHLYRLRQKIEDGLNLKDFIVTDEGFYSLKL